MGILQVTLFRDVHFTHDNWFNEVIITREVQALLAYLLIQRHRVHSREALSGIFWGEHSQEKARGSLNTALWKLKKALEPEGIPFGTYLKNPRPGAVSFNQESQYWLDVEVFEEEVNRILTYPFQTVKEAQVVNLENTLVLYKGELLEGFYDDWALRERERLRALYVKGLFYLLQYYGFRKTYEKAIACGQQILALDPLWEEIHQEMMRLYLGNGQRVLALRQYEICRETLAKEFGIAPMEDTQALYKQIYTGNYLGRLPTSSKEQISVDQAIGQLREASQIIDLAKDQIQQALLLIASYSELPDLRITSDANKTDR